ncbi:hypothetical protein BGZ95_003510 [Linnemannia exigua]|uniref:Uncharacterized protein n=1 Tax=Linnemannia exigua TaxID=604196 RepID=A0AAD4D473_9FUNG|nr:hypothetical protein BGZ95_003510 [Linnemannia exigua]
MVEIRQQSTISPTTTNNNSATKQQPSIYDIEKEVYDEFAASQGCQGNPNATIATDGPDDEFNPDVQEAIDKKLEDEDHEDEIAKICKGFVADKLRRQGNQGSQGGRNKMTGGMNTGKSGEREVQAGGGRRQGIGTGGDIASTATDEQKAKLKKNDYGRHHDDNDDEEGEEEDVESGETTHDKRSRAGYMGASAKVGYVDSDTAMTRAKFKYEGPEGLDPFSDLLSLSASEIDTPVPSHLEKDDNGNISKYELGSKLWEKIFLFFYPSELSVLASVNKEGRSRIYHLPVWQTICEGAGLALPADQLEAHDFKRPNYYQLAHENASMICEVCYTMTRPAGSLRALPVAITDTAVPSVIRMCRDCRVDYYIDHPEPIPDDVTPYKTGDYTVTPRMTKGDAMKTYLLTDSDVMSLPYEIGRNPYFGSNSPMYLFEEQHVLRLARQVHGGDAGIVANRADSDYAGRKIPEPHNEVVKHRRNLLRSLLHDKGLHLPENAAICNIYIETGLGNPLEIVNELEVVDWFHRCTSYDPSLNKAHLQQVKLRPRINRRRRTLPEGETLISANSGGVAAQSIQDEVMTKEEEEEDDQHKMAALDSWLTHRLEEGKYRSYKLDPESPKRPPKTIWPMLDKIDMTHKLLEFGAEKVCRLPEKKMNELDKVARSKGQIREIVDACEKRGSAIRSSEPSHQKRRKTDGGRESGGKEDPKLSTILEHDLGSDWHIQVVKRAKELVNSLL